MVFYIAYDWFPDVNQARAFAREHKGKVYPEDLFGGYKVLYPKYYKVRMCEQKGEFYGN